MPSPAEQLAARRGAVDWRWRGEGAAGSAGKTEAAAAGLDAVLALGPVTVQARKTLASLASPRRPGPRAGTLTVVIEGYDLPGLTCQPEPAGRRHHNVHVALSGRSEDRPALTVPGRPGLATEPVPGDAPSARWEVPVVLRRDEDSFDFGGPFAGGDQTDRHLGLVRGDVPGDGTLRLFRGAKPGPADGDAPCRLAGGNTMRDRVRRSANAAGTRRGQGAGPGARSTGRSG